MITFMLSTYDICHSIHEVYTSILCIIHA